MTKKKLTQKEAWRLVGRLFRKVKRSFPRSDEYRGCGLSKVENKKYGGPNDCAYGMCYAIERLAKDGFLSDNNMGAMLERIEKELDKLDLEHWLFLFPCTAAGAKGRVAFCQKQARRLK